MSFVNEKDHASVRPITLRDRLWRTFELMSEEQEKSVDDLVNDAMTSYAQLAGYETTGNTDGIGPAGVTPVSAVNVNSPSSPMSPISRARSAREHGPGSSLPPVPGPVPVRMGRPPAIPSIRAVPAVPSGGERSSALPAPVEGAAPGNATLFLMFDNQKYRIDKEQFIIGRGSKSSDLSIKDGNISRKHAAVIRRNGVYFVKDLGSTNGIDFKGMRIDNKRIDEGDVFYICEYELKFTYKR